MAMCGKVPSNQNGSELTRRVVNIVRKWDMMGELISVSKMSL
jgi:hypothetical protein